MQVKSGIFTILRYDLDCRYTVCLIIQPLQFFVAFRKPDAQTMQRIHIRNHVVPFQYSFPLCQVRSDKAVFAEYGIKSGLLPQAGFRHRDFTDGKACGCLIGYAQHFLARR